MGGEGRGWETQTVRGRGQRSPAPQALWRSCQSNSPQGHQKGQPNKDGRQCVWSSCIYCTSSKGEEHWLRVNQPARDCVDSLWITDIHVLCSVFTSGWHWLLCNTQEVSVNGVASVAFKYCQWESFTAC